MDVTRSLRSNYSDIVTILVGSENQKFVVHQDLICGTSEFFKAATSNGWKEAGDKEVHLAEQHPVAFKIYLEFIYNPCANVCAQAQIHAEELLDPGERALHLKSAAKNGLALAKLTVLGDYLGDVRSKDSIIYSAWEKIKSKHFWFPAAALKMVFELLPASNGMQKFCADLMASIATTQKHIDEVKEMSSPMCIEPVLRATLRVKDKNFRWDYTNYIETEESRE